MLKRVYIEITIPSFYFEERPEAEMRARRDWTREWWDEKRRDNELVTSEAVLDELEDGDHPHREAALRLIGELALLPIVKPVYAVVEEYIRRQVMPRDPGGDALHLALASYHRCHFLLTWNCRHLANANKIEHIRYVNMELGLSSPILTTPFDML